MTLWLGALQGGTFSWSEPVKELVWPFWPWKNSTARSGAKLGGALLESPFDSLQEAVINHLRGTLGAADWFLRPGEALELAEAGRQAHFDPWCVSPRVSCSFLRTPIAFLTGDRDAIPPLAGVAALAAFQPGLTIVPGAGHLEAGAMVPGGWRSWAITRLRRWGFG